MGKWTSFLSVALLCHTYGSDLEILSGEEGNQSVEKSEYLEEKNSPIDLEEKNSEISELKEEIADKPESKENEKILVSQNLSKKEENHSSVQQVEKKSKIDFFARGDLLYWIAEGSGFETNFGSGHVTKLVSGEGVQESIVFEKDIDPEFNWDLGYRIFLGSRFVDDIWGVYANFTHFQGKANKNLNNGKWSVRLDQIDLVGNYKGVLNSSLFLETLFGLRLTEIYQKLHGRVVTPILVSGSGTALDTRNFDDKQKFDGIGPLLGLNADLKLGAGFGFYGTLSGSLLYGRYFLTFKDSENVTAPLTPAYIESTIHKHMRAFDFDLDLAFGFTWRAKLSNDVFLTLLAGLENHQYFNQNRIGSNWGNLSFSGAVFSLKLTF
jgi:hypothetical protein